MELIARCWRCQFLTGARGALRAMSSARSLGKSKPP
jgi:hypothetical protein